QVAVALRNARLFEEVRQANAAKTDFISYLSHEVRNPINNVLHTTNLILNYPDLFQNIPLPDAYSSDLLDIQRYAQLMSNLHYNVLDLAKIEAGKMEVSPKVVDPTSILESVRENALIQLQKGVELRAKYKSPLPLVIADDLRLTQALTNIVGNAVKFTT